MTILQPAFQPAASQLLVNCTLLIAGAQGLDLGLRAASRLCHLHQVCPLDGISFVAHGTGLVSARQTAGVRRLKGGGS